MEGMKMKNTFKTIMIAAAAAASLSSCNVLDVDPTGWYSESVAYASVDNMDLYVKGLYSIMYANADIAQGYIFDDGVSDLIKYSWYGVLNQGGRVNQFFYTGSSFTAESNFRSNWANYTYIRQLNEFFYDVHQGYASGIDKEQLAIRVAEVRFLRAFAYQELALRHGGVILRVDEDHVDGPADAEKARSSKEDTWNWIINEYTKAEKDLPESWSGVNAGRITSGAATAMKARAALYAGRYKDAVDAATEVIDSGNYSLLEGNTYEKYYKIFTDPNNSELILPVYYAQSTGNGGKQHNFNSYFCPPGDGKELNEDGTVTIKNPIGAAATPTEEYASSFDIKYNGAYHPFDWNKLAEYGGDPYSGREPRFYASILHNNEVWKGRKLELYDGGFDGYMDFSETGQDNDHRTTTGYIFRKFMSDDTKMNYTSILSGQYWIEMRLAELYLIRSEANARLGNWSLAYDDLNVIRKRVGLQDKGMKVDWDSYVEDLSKERVCELGLEGHRNFDLVRWGLAQKVLDHKRMHGVRITKKSDGTFTYEVVECDTRDRLYPSKYNIFPIPITEMQRNSLCEQNLEWL